MSNRRVESATRESPRVRVLFFSRGRGHGHAIPDMEIASSLLKQAPGLQIRFVSYATGARTFRERGEEVIDVKLSETPSFTDTILAFHTVLQNESPDAIISHEEFGALVAAE